jgi:N-acetylglucosamine malate deacetylase 2
MQEAPPHPSADVLSWLTARPIAARTIVVAPHPDDETIGAGIALARMEEGHVVHLTDGAPADRRFWTARCASRADYARVREAEAAAALLLAGIPPGRVHRFACPDQQLIDHVGEAVDYLRRLIARELPDVLVTTPYEGAHPDHDAAAVACRLAVDTVAHATGWAPWLVEMTSYHLAEASLRAGAFLPADTPAAELLPDTAELALKRRMLASYASQADMLTHFPAGPERFRIAPRYDFGAPPHAGTLFYETIGIPLRPAAWRAQAVAAIGTYAQGVAAIGTHAPADRCGS